MNNGKSETGMATEHIAQVPSKEEAVGEREYFRSVQKMVDAIDKNKMLVERVMGSTDFDWSFVKLGFEGTVLKPTELTAFDKAICGVLLIKRTCGKLDLALVFGFDIKNDASERDLFDKEIESLADVGMIEGDDSVLWLTETGKEFARRGEKIKTFNEKFELCMSSLAGFKHNVVEALQKLDVKEVENEGDQLFGGETFFEESEDNEEDGELDGSVFRDITDAAAVQAPEVHFPSKMFFLKQCKLVGKKYLLTRLKVVLLENFRDGTNRALVYDEKNGCVLEPLSEVFSHSEEQMKLVFEKYRRKVLNQNCRLKARTKRKAANKSNTNRRKLRSRKSLIRQ